jgi:hypothetical protein
MIVKESSFETSEYVLYADGNKIFDLRKLWLNLNSNLFI